MIGVVILNYNGWDMTINCVESLRISCNMSFKIYIVDNASTTKMPFDFQSFIKQSEDCELIINTENRGYSAGNNIGIKKALEDGCTHILISNNDVLFKKNSVEELCNFLDENPDYGIAGPKVYLSNGKIQEINMGCKMTLAGKYKYILRKTPLKKCSKNFVQKFHALDHDLMKPFDVYAVSGCCFMLSQKAAAKLFPLDENTFLYEEENIIGIKMEKLGLKTIYDTDSEIIHLGGESTKGISEFAYTCLIESEIYYCLQYLRSLRIQIIPLYIIRTGKYMSLFGKSKFGSYLIRTCKMLWKKRRD